MKMFCVQLLKLLMYAILIDQIIMIQVHENTSENVTTIAPILKDTIRNTTEQSAAITDITSKKPMQYPKIGEPTIKSTTSTPASTTIKSVANGDLTGRVENSKLVDKLSEVQTLTNNKKRQLYIDVSNYDNNNGSNHGHSAISFSTKDFIPSPELTNSQEDEDRIAKEIFKPNEGYRPFKVESFYPYPQKDSKWIIGTNNFRYVGTEHKHVTGKQIFSPTSNNNYDQPSLDNVKNYEKSGVKGKWKWIPEDSDDLNVESKIMNQPITYENFEQLTLAPPVPEYHPYQFEFGHHHGSQQELYQSQTPQPQLQQQYHQSQIQQPQTVQQSQKPQTLQQLQQQNQQYQSHYQQTPFSFSLDNSQQQPLSHNKDLSNIPSQFETPTQYKEVVGKEFNKPKQSPWKKIVHVLTAAIPIGLIISALTPHVVYINPNSTKPTPPSFSALSAFPPRQRSLDEPEASDVRAEDEQFKKLASPLMDFINLFNDNNTNTDNDDIEYDHNASCEDRMFCEMARMGAKKDAEMLYKMLWKIANETPEDRASQSGLGIVFKAIRTNQCTIFKCDSPTST